MLLNEAERNSRPAVGDTSSVQQMQEYDQYIHHTREVARRHQVARDRLHQQVQTKQNRLRERHVSEEMMNKLKQRDYVRYCLEERREDRKLMDEIAVMRHGRRHSRGDVT